MPCGQLWCSTCAAASRALFWLKPGIHSNLQGYGVYRYANKYGANVDGYSPIYTPDTWSESGEC